MTAILKRCNIFNFFFFFFCRTVNFYSPYIYGANFIAKFRWEMVFYAWVHSSGVSSGCIACACTPGGLRGAPKRRGETERSKERERKKGKEKGRQRRREGKGKKMCKRKGKEGRNQKKIEYKKKNTRVATRE